MQEAGVWRRGEDVVMRMQLGICPRFGAKLSDVGASLDTATPRIKTLRSSLDCIPKDTRLLDDSIDRCHMEECRLRYL